MAEVTALTTIRGLWDYHWWANRRLFDVVAGLGEEAAGRDVGRQFSHATLRRMLAHIYGADWIWLRRWLGTSPPAVPGDEIATLGELRQHWDGVEAEQRSFLGGLAPADLDRVVAWTSTEGRAHREALWWLLHHVPAHAVHHRSEVATMVTMVSGSPPESGLLTYRLLAGRPEDAGRR